MHFRGPVSQRHTAHSTLPPPPSDDRIHSTYSCCDNVNMSLVIYGIRNCDTIKKTLKWLDSQAISYRFHDYRKEGLSPELLAEFAVNLGWEALLNKRGTTYRVLSEELKAQLDERSALALMLAQPALIKRPLLVLDHRYLLGFDESQYQALLG